MAATLLLLLLLLLLVMKGSFLQSVLHCSRAAAAEDPVPLHHCCWL
jgi:hypothetical protein